MTALSWITPARNVSFIVCRVHCQGRSRDECVFHVAGGGIPGDDLRHLCGTVGQVQVAQVPVLGAWPDTVRTLRLFRSHTALTLLRPLSSRRVPKSSVTNPCSHPECCVQVSAGRERPVAHRGLRQGPAGARAEHAGQLRGSASDVQLRRRVSHAQRQSERPVRRPRGGEQPCSIVPENWLMYPASGSVCLPLNHVAK